MPLLDDEELFDDLPVDHHSCRLLGPTALIVQALMGLLVISSLVYKRHRESPMRPWRIWFFDVSKQITGQMFVHGVNVLISGVVAKISAGNACVLYFLNILIDTTLGVAIIYLILHLLTNFMTVKCGFKGFESGEYGNPPLFSYWLRQTTIYVLSLTTMKLLVVSLFAIWPGIFKVGEWLLSFLGTSDVLQVIFTMGLFPIMMNIIQFWLIDSIVKSSAHSSPVALPTDSARNSADPDTEPLFRGSIDDDDDDDGVHPHDIENQRSHRSRSISPDSLDADELKSSAATSATASGSGTVTPKVVDTRAATPVVHAYPPSIASTSSSPASSRPNSISPPKRKRSPPPPLALQPIPHATQASLPQLAVSPADTHVERITDEKEWAAWDDHVDDWAGRVGEEDWTGRRMHAKKDVLRNVWADSDAHGDMTLRASS